MRMKVGLMILWGLLISAGCQEVSVNERVLPENPPLSTIQPDSATRKIPTPDRFNASPTNLPELIPPTEMVPAVTGEAPEELLDRIMADLTKRTGIATNRLLISRAQAVVWNDGSLGCPQPDILYTQALVNGYWVILEVDGTTYDYRASESGYFFLCENGLPLIAPPGTPDS